MDENTRPQHPDIDYFRRRVCMAGAAFAVPIELKPGEHLRDAVVRAIERNGYHHTDIAMELAKPRTFRSLSPLNSVAAVDEIERLIDVLGVRRDDAVLKHILSKTNSRSREFVSFFGQQLRRSHLVARRRVSPRSLALSGYQRAIWSVRWITFDPRTMETLLERCPVCERELGWGTTKGLSFCDKCSVPKVDLRDHPQITIEPLDGEALSFFVNTIDPDLSDSEFWGKWPGFYPSSSRGELFEFLIRIAMECQRFQSHRRGLVSLIENRQFERAGRALLDWPTSFLELMNELSEVENDTRALYSLRNDSNISSGIRDHLKALFEHRRRSRAMTLSKGLPDLIQGSVVSLPLKVLPRRAAIRKLTLTPALIGRRLGRSFCVVRDIKSVRARSQALGLSVPDVIELYLAGFVQDLAVDLRSLGIFPDAELRPKDLEHLLHCAKHISLAKSMRLSTARFIFDKNLTSKWSDIFQAIIDGELQVSCAPYSGRGLAFDLMVGDFVSLERILSRRPKSSPFHDVSITQAEMGMLMGKSSGIASSVSRLLGFDATPKLDKLSDIRAAHAIGFELEGMCLAQDIKVRNIYEQLSKAGISHKRRNRVTIWSRAAAEEYLNIDAC